MEEVLNFQEAQAALQSGKKVKLPEWTGFWFKDKKDGVMKVFTKNGEILFTPDIATHGSRNDWQITDGKLGFDFAILALKNGKRVKRSSWKGKDKYVFMRPEDTLSVETIVEKVKSLPQSVKDFFTGKPADQEVKFTKYLCYVSGDGTVVNGWTPSIIDLMAEDYTLAD